MKIGRFDTKMRGLLSRKLQSLPMGGHVWVDVRKAGRWVSVRLKRVNHNQFKVEYMQYRSSLVGHEKKDKLIFGNGGATYISNAKRAIAANDLIRFVEHFELSNESIEQSIKDREIIVEPVIVEVLPMFPTIDAIGEEIFALAVV